MLSLSSHFRPGIVDYHSFKRTLYGRLGMGAWIAWLGGGGGTWYGLTVVGAFCGEPGMGDLVSGICDG